jgi:hypothetical protein
MLIQILIEPCNAPLDGVLRGIDGKSPYVLYWIFSFREMCHAF